MNRKTQSAAELDAAFLLTALLILVAVMFGGSSRENPLRLAAVEVCALPLLAAAVRRGISPGRPGGDAVAPLALLGLSICVPLLQLAPLPPSLWTLLPGQAPRIQALALAGLPQPWLPISLSPGETVACALALIPPAAMFLATLHFSAAQRRRLAVLWVVLACAGLALGAAQITARAGSPVYTYRTTNGGSLVGLFANRNHQAAFLLALAPFAGALMGASPGRAGATPRAWWPGLFIAIAVVALGVIRSRAGILLAGPALIGASAVFLRSRSGHRRWPVALGVAGAVVIAVGAVAFFGLSPIVARFAAPAASETRAEAWPYIVAAAQSHLPFGAGLGAFDRVYQAVEPLNLVSPYYLNHAHNDYLELWLETGWIGVGCLGLFALWLARGMIQAWRRNGGDLARAASISIVLLMAASVVDYPLRTETLLVLLAYCCGLLIRPPASRP